ncbi:hypothetical protein VTO42DRAFT_7864 [Malbranchea cinnamomea]
MVDFKLLFSKLEGLTDLETAILLCIVAREHCIIDTERDALDDLENELKLAAENIFALSYSVIRCSPYLSTEEFTSAILSQDGTVKNSGSRSASLLSHSTSRDPGSLRFRNVSPSRGRSRAGIDSRSDVLKVTNIVVARDLDQAPEEVQLQALEILQSRQISTRLGTFNIPSTFVFISLLSTDGRMLSSVLNKHLIDHIFISHYHDPRDGFVNLEGDSGWLVDERNAMRSGDRNAYSSPGNFSRFHLIQNEDVRALRQLVDAVTMSPDMNRYLHNIVVFLRLSREVASGISASATRHFQLLSRCLAPLQQMDFVCPSLVAAAARKVYRHRIVVSKPEDDRSILYGSSLKAVEVLLANATVENTIERVLLQVEAPL